MYSKQKCILCPSAEEMRGLAACPKIQKSKNPSFQTESLDSGQKDGFLDFPRFFLDFFGFFERVFGFLGFQIKNPKKLKEKDGFLQKSNFYLHFFGFFGKINLFPCFFGFLISGLEKSIFFLGFFFWIFAKIHLFPWVFYLFLKNQSFPLGFLLFLKNPSFSLSFFGFLTWKPKNPNTLSKNPKKSQKTLGNPKIHLFDLNPKILFEKMDFWIFG